MKFKRMPEFKEGSCGEGRTICPGGEYEVAGAFTESYRPINPFGPRPTQIEIVGGGSGGVVLLLLIVVGALIGYIFAKAKK